MISQNRERNTKYMKKILTAIILICFLSLFGCANTQDEDTFGPTLPGADEIYPTIPVDEVAKSDMGSVDD